MVVFQITIAILLAAILGTVLARKIRLPLELTLVVGSLGVALIPGLPAVHLDSEVIFFVFLPPILFAAAYFTSWSEFKKNIRPISFLALGLVVFTVCGMALVVKWLVPTLTWPMAFLFGAIVSPPDASAATTVTRGAGFPRRLQVVLEGESLVNDATGARVLSLCARRPRQRRVSLAGEHRAVPAGRTGRRGHRPRGDPFDAAADAVHPRRQRRSAALAGHPVCLLFRRRVTTSVWRDRDCGRRTVRRPDVARAGPLPKPGSKRKRCGMSCCLL